MTATKLRDARLTTALVGVLFVVLLAGFATLGVAYGFGVFSSSKTVTAVLPEAGPALGPGSEVEYRGVLVGKLGTLTREPQRAVLTLDITPSQIDHIPSGVTVRLVPRSVFGDLYVDLVPPAQVSGHLEPGTVLQADTSTPSVELNQSLDAGYRLLTAIQPAKLSDTLSAVATALDGRGAKLGALVSDAARYTAEVAPHTSQLVHDIAVIGTLAGQVAANTPNLLRTLDDSVALSSTIARQQVSLKQLLTGGPVVASRTNALLANNRNRLVTLVHELHPVIGILGRRRAQLAETLLQLRLFTSGAARALGHGNYLRVAVVATVDPRRGRAYTAANCPRYHGMVGPNCPHGSAGGRAR